MPKNQRNPHEPPDKRSAANRRFAERQVAKEPAALVARKKRNRMVGLGSIVLVLVIVARSSW